MTEERGQPHSIKDCSSRIEPEKTKGARMKSGKKGRSIELFFVDGDPEGMLTATIPFQWTGHVLVTSRTQLKEALDRPEVERPGVYMLVGEIEGDPKLYIGETDDIKTRIKNHAANKDWWTTVVCISSNGEPLNKAHARYLESRLIQDAKRLRKIDLDNEQAPPERALSEAALAQMEDFLDNIYLVLPALRFDFFTEQTKPDPPKSDAPSEVQPVYFVLKVKRQGVKARARLDQGKFVVEAGSVARKEWAGSTTAQSSYAKLFDELVEQGILELQGTHRVFTSNYAFKSTSAAAAVVTGRPASGPGEWKLEGTDKNYSEWEEDVLSQSDGDAE